MRHTVFVYGAKQPPQRLAIIRVPRRRRCWRRPRLLRQLRSSMVALWWRAMAIVCGWRRSNAHSVVLPRVVPPVVPRVAAECARWGPAVISTTTACAAPTSAVAVIWARIVSLARDSWRRLVVVGARGAGARGTRGRGCVLRHHRGSLSYVSFAALCTGTESRKMHLFGLRMHRQPIRVEAFVIRHSGGKEFDSFVQL